MNKIKNIIIERDIVTIIFEDKRKKQEVQMDLSEANGLVRKLQETLWRYAVVRTR